MKNIKHLLVLVAALFFSANVLMAQTTTTDINCDQASIVAQSCVGACDNPGYLSYDLNICDAKVIQMCLSNIATSLCPTHRAIAYIWVDGQLVDRGDITPLGSNIIFKAECGSTIKVAVYAYDLISGIACVQLGNLDFALKR